MAGNATSTSLLTVPNIDWEDIRSFLETARRGSFTAAAAHLDLSINSVRRRIANLETTVSHQLLIRSSEGISLTPHGVQLLEKAKRMEDAAFDLLGATRPSPRSDVVTIRLGAHDSFGPLWLAPRLIEYQARNPKVIVELLCAFRSSEIAALGTELFVQVGRQPPSEFVSLRLGRIHSVPTVSERFVRAHQMPQSLEQLKRHRLFLLDRPLSQQVFDRVFPQGAQDDLVRLRTNNSIVQLYAVLSGGGFAWMPTYMHSVTPGLHVVPIGQVFSSDIWLARRVGESPQSEELWHWVISSFDRKRFPWFDDQYIPPDRFGDQASRSSSFLS